MSKIKNKIVRSIQFNNNKIFNKMKSLIPTNSLTQNQ
jgi:hypothetical protein